MTLPIEKIIVLSTMHLTKEVAEALPVFVTNDADLSLTPWWPSWTRPEGWMFYVPPRDAEDARYANAPVCIQACVNMARAVGCCWLMLDRDGTVLDGLPTWEW
jgi:hypothetical protein